MKSSVIVDYSWLYHCARSVALQSSSSHNQIDSIVFHALNKWRTLESKIKSLGFTDFDLIMAEDRVAVRKLQSFPSYRAGRVNRSEEKHLIKKLLKQSSLKCFWAYSEGNEADDTIASLVQLATVGNLFSIVVTADRDMWQLLSETVAVLNPIKKEIVSEENVHKAFRCLPHQIPLVKSFFGDSGDCVPNLMPRQQKHILPIIKMSDGTIDNCHNLIINTPLPEKIVQLYRRQQEAIRLNYSLVKLDPGCQLQWG